MSSPSQLFSCIDSTQILKSPINTSPSKLQWSFNKTQRFNNKKIYCDSIYNISGMQKNENRKAGMGKGKKTDLDYGKNPQLISPSPDSYLIPSFADINKAHKKGFTPRYSRQQIAPMSYIGFPYKYNTGPGRYDQYRINQSPKWTMRPKVNSQIFPQTTIKINPSPSDYKNQQQLNKIGKYHLSHHKNSKSKVFNPPCSKRFLESGSFAPGSGAYNPKNDLSNQGIYILSKDRSAGKRTFLLGNRQSFTEITARRKSYTPGPGSYRLPSDFGHYDQKPLTRSFIKLEGNKTQRTARTSSKSKRQ